MGLCRTVEQSLWKKLAIYQKSKLIIHQKESKQTIQVLDFFFFL